MNEARSNEQWSDDERRRVYKRPVKGIDHFRWSVGVMRRMRYLIKWASEQLSVHQEVRKRHEGVDDEKLVKNVTRSKQCVVVIRVMHASVPMHNNVRPCERRP